MLAATRNPRCWPTMRFCTMKGERWMSPLFSLLDGVCASLQSLTLDVAFGNTRLGVAVPTGLTFTSLRRLSLSVWDIEAMNLVTELLECIESPLLQKVALEGSMITE